MAERSERRVAIASAASLLMATRKAKRSLSDAADDVLDEVTYKADRVPSKRASAFSLILNTSKLLVPALTGALVASESAIGSLARATLIAEFKAVGFEADVHGLSDLDRFMARESIWAQSAAESLSLQWRNRALSSVNRAISKESSLSKAFRDSRNGMQSSLDRTAITETTRAYQDARLEELRQLTDISPSAAKWIEQNDIVREWVCMIDACPDCRELDGEQCSIDGSFPGGASIPMHPRCQCQEIITSASNSARRAA